MVSPVSVYSAVQYGVYRVPRTPSKHDHKSHTNSCQGGREGQNRSYSAVSTGADYFQDDRFYWGGRLDKTGRIVIHGVFLFSVVGWGNFSSQGGQGGSPSPPNILSHIRLDWSQDSFIIFPPSSSSHVMHHINVIVIKCEVTVII